MGQIETLPLTYAFIKKERNEPNMSIGIALSELIDNSISSWIDGGKNKKLEIEIKYFEDKKIYEIIDNAYGFFSKEHLIKSMHFFSVPKGSENSMNNYGFGMKSAIFWIGENAKIYTKRNNGDEFVGEYLIEDKSDNAPVSVFVNDSNIDGSLKSNMENYSHGTKIQINDVYGDRRKLTDAMVKQIQSLIGYRYANYIQEENVNITLIRVENGLDNRFDIKPESHLWNPKKHVFKWKEEISFLKNKNQNEIISILESEGIFENDYPEFYKKILNDEFLILEENEFLQINENIKIPVKFFINKTADCKSCGANILEKNRYLCHPAKDTQKAEKNGFKPYLNDEIGKRSFLGGHGKWGLLEFNIDEQIIKNKNKFQNEKSHQNDYYIYPEKNKKTITFNPSATNPDLFTEDELFSAIKKYYENKRKLLDFFSKWSQKSDDNETIKDRYYEAKFKNSIERNSNFNEENEEFPNEIPCGALNDYIKLNKTVKYSFVYEPKEFWVIKNIKTFGDNNSEIKYQINTGSKFIIRLDEKNKEIIEQSYIFLIYLDLMMRNELVFEGNETIGMCSSIPEALENLERFWIKK